MIPMNNFLRNKAECYKVQDTLFCDKPARLDLQKVDIHLSSPHCFTVNVWRNHAIEPIIPLCRPYFSYGNLQCNFRISDYDDTLMFSNHEIADVEFLWLDSTYYIFSVSKEKWFDWLIERVTYLRKLTYAPIVIATWLPELEDSLHLERLIDNLPMVYFANLGRFCSELGVCLIDERIISMAGTRVSALAQVLIARKLACHWLTATILPPIKAVVLDLDNTLHSGVLAEEGIHGVHLTESHKDFQNSLKKLREKGIFLALVSHNEIQDVRSLFLQRLDYPLNWDDFAVAEISWRDKADSIHAVADKLRISFDSILFVDDNIGVLLNVCSNIPTIHTLHANLDAKITQTALEHYPGLWRWKIGLDDKKRLEDLRANHERELIFADAHYINNYFHSLQVCLMYKYDNIDCIDRLADLCRKTNQFNLSMNRFNQLHILDYIHSDMTSVCSVQLKDRLSDSGIIAVIIAKRYSDHLLIDEICISCRALGRRLEDVIIIAGIRNMKIFQGCKTIIFNVRYGARNQPALDWLKKLTQLEYLPQGLHSVSSEIFDTFIVPEGVSMEVLWM